MDNQNVVNTWHKAIIEKAEYSLKRNLTERELNFIKSRGSFMALEMIDAKVSNSDSTEIERYLNSEN